MGKVRLPQEAFLNFAHPTNIEPPFVLGATLAWPHSLTKEADTNECITSLPPPGSLPCLPCITAQQNPNFSSHEKYPRAITWLMSVTPAGPGVPQ